MRLRANPQTTGSELTIEINRLIGTSYLHPNNLRVQMLRLRLDDLKLADRIEGLLLHAYLEHLTGSIEEVDRLVALAVIAGADEFRIVDVYGPALINLGYFSRARRLLVSAAQPHKGNFTSFRMLLLWSGAIATLVEYSDLSDKLGIAQAKDEMSQLSRLVSDILKEHEMTEEQLSSILDLAGEVMRERAVIFVGEFPEIEVLANERPTVVHVKFPLDLSPNDIADANFRLAELLAMRDEDVPEVLHVSFLATI